MNKLILIALLATSPLAMAEERTDYHLPDYAGDFKRQTDQMEQNQRLLNIENQLRQQEWERTNRYYERLREGNERYGKGN